MALARGICASDGIVPTCHMGELWYHFLWTASGAYAGYVLGCLVGLRMRGYARSGRTAAILAITGFLAAFAWLLLVLAITSVLPNAAPLVAVLTAGVGIGMPAVARRWALGGAGGAGGHRGPVRALRVTVLLLLATTAACGGASDPDPGPILTAARRHCLTQEDPAFRSRCLSAEQEFAEALETAPSDRRAYLLSFQRPVPVLDLFEAIEQRPGVEVLELHLWYAAPHSELPGVGVRHADSLGLPDAAPEQIAAALRREALSYLRERARGLEEFPQNPTIRRQIAEAKAAERLILREGPLAYGLRCVCSAAEVVALDERLPGLEVRTAEWATFFEQQQPIWPEDD